MAVGLSKLGDALVAIFAVCLVILAADLAYVLWRRRRFRRRSTSTASAAGDSSVYVLSSKELLYFFCWKNQSRIEPSVDQVSNTNGPDRSRDVDRSSIDDEDALKLHEGMCGPSRLLFTIKEEEEAERSTNGQDHFDDRDDDVAVADVVLTVEPEFEATPFSTPCASPPYYTPSPSPTRSHGSYGGAAILEIIGV